MKPRLLGLALLSLGGLLGSACSQKPKPIVYLDNGTAADVQVAVDGAGAHRVPAWSILRIEVERGRRALKATSADGGAVQEASAELESDRRYVFNIGGKNAHFIYTQFYTPQGREAETATQASPDRLGQGEPLFAFPSWMWRDLNERPPAKIAVKEEGETDMKYVFHKPIHRDRPCCAAIKDMHWPDEVRAAIDRAETFQFEARQEHLQEQSLREMAQPQESEAASE